MAVSSLVVYVNISHEFPIFLSLYTDDQWQVNELGFLTLTKLRHNEPLYKYKSNHKVSTRLEHFFSVTKYITTCYHTIIDI